MTCATHAQLARGEAVHDCLACHRARAQQDDIKALLARLPPPALATDRRAALAAEVLARAEVVDEPRPSLVRWLAVGGVVIAAATAAIIVAHDDDPPRRSAVRPASVVQVDPPSAPSAPSTPDPEPEIERASPRVVVAPPPAPVEEAPAPRSRSDRTRQVFGASSDRHLAGIERDAIDVSDTGVAAFRTGWEALRGARYGEAVAAFDRATDPAVAEDAAFWAAIAAQRAGDLSDARKRLDGFLARFPDSPRADDARRAREVLR